MTNIEILHQVFLSLKLYCPTKEDIDYLLNIRNEKIFLSSKNLHFLEKIFQFLEIHFQELIKIANYDENKFLFWYNKQLHSFIDVSFSSGVSFLKKIHFILNKDPKEFFRSVTTHIKMLKDNNNFLKPFGINLYDAFQVYPNIKEILLFFRGENILNFFNSKDIQTIKENFIVTYIKRGPLINIKKENNKKVKFKVKCEENIKEIEIMDSFNIWELIIKIILIFKVNISFYSIFCFTDGKKKKIKKKIYNKKINEYFQEAHEGNDKFIEIEKTCEKQKSLRFLYFYGDKCFHPDIFDIVVIWARKCFEKKNNIFPVNLNDLQFPKEFKSEEGILNYIIEEGQKNNFDILNLIIVYDSSNEPHLRNFEIIQEMEQLLIDIPINDIIIEEAEEKEILKEMLKNFEKIKDKTQQRKEISKIKNFILDEIIKNHKDEVITSMSKSFFCYFEFWNQKPENELTKKIRSAMLINLYKIQIVNSIFLKDNDLNYIRINLEKSEKLDKCKRNDKWLLNIIQAIIKNSLTLKHIEKFFSGRVNINKLADIQMLKCSFHCYSLSYREKTLELLAYFLKCQNFTSIDESPLDLLKSFLDILIRYEIPPSSKYVVEIITKKFIELIKLLLPEEKNNLAMKLLRNIFLCSFTYCDMTLFFKEEETLNIIKEKMKNYDFKFQFAVKTFWLNYKTILFKTKVEIIQHLFNYSYLNVILCLLFLENINIDKIGTKFKKIFKYLEYSNEIEHTQANIINEFEMDIEKNSSSEKFLNMEPKKNINSVKEACEFFSEYNPNCPIKFITTKEETEEGRDKFFNEKYKNYKYFIIKMTKKKDFQIDEYEKNNIFLRAKVSFDEVEYRQMVVGTNDYFEKIGIDKQKFKNNYLFLKRKKNINKYPYILYSYFFRNFEFAKIELTYYDISKCRDFTWEFFCNYANILKEKKRLNDESKIKNITRDKAFENIFIENFKEYKDTKPHEYDECFKIFKKNY